MKIQSHVTYAKKTGRLLLAFSLLASALLSSSVQAQQIFWNAPAAVTGDTDIATNGTSVYAYDYSLSSEVVNGVTFTGANSANAGGNVGTTLTTFNTSIFNATSNVFAGLSSSYQGILVGSAYGSTSNLYTMSLSNLTSGHIYLVQVWVNDPRGAENTRTEILSSTGGNSVQLHFSTGPGTTGGYPGQYCIGYFTNYGAPQIFTLQSPNQLSGADERGASPGPRAVAVVQRGRVEWPRRRDARFHLAQLLHQQLQHAARQRRESDGG